MNADTIGIIIGKVIRIVGGSVAFSAWQHDPLAGIAFAALLLTLEK